MSHRRQQEGVGVNVRIVGIILRQIAQRSTPQRRQAEVNFSGPTTRVNPESVVGN